MTALMRTVRVDSTSASFKCCTRLLEPGFTSAGIWHTNSKTKRQQTSSVILRVQFDIGENHAIAAETALKAKAFRCGVALICFQSPHRLGPITSLGNGLWAGRGSRSC